MWTTMPYPTKSRTASSTVAQHLIQPKLKIGKLGDKYEQEADRVADAVMRMPDGQVQRQPVEEEKEALQMQPTEEDEMHQMQPAEEEELQMEPMDEEEMVQMQSAEEEEEEFFSGVVHFNGCQNQRENFFMIPEHKDSPGYHPSRNREFNVDGFWFKFHTPENEWWKIPGGATTYVTCNEEDERNPDIRRGWVYIPFRTHGWSDDDIHVDNPY